MISLHKLLFLVSMLLLTGIIASLNASPLVDNLKAGKDQVVVVYGTSLTENGAWVEQLGQRLNTQGFPGKATVTNKGVGGSTTVSHGIKDYPPRLVDQPQPAVPLEQFRKNLVTIVDRLRKDLPATEVFLMTMNPAFDSTATPDSANSGNSGKYHAALSDYYQTIRDIGAAKSVQVIDIYPEWLALQKADIAKLKLFIPYGVYPIPAGNEAITTPSINAALTC